MSLEVRWGRRAHPIVLMVISVAWLPALAGTDPLSDGLRRCARETDQTQRLACFDALAGSLPKLQADQFGMTATLAQKRNQEAPHQREQAEALTAKITGLHESPEGRFIFTLDNGQVWAQDESRLGISFTVGDAVRLEHGAMSSLWLTADHGRKTRVKRLK